MITQQGVFLHTLALYPYRIAGGIFFALLNSISGITTNVYFYTQRVSDFALLCEGTPFSFVSVLGAALWQLLLCCAALYGRGAGARISAAFAAISLESFVLGFSVSELLFHYGEKNMLLVLLLCIFCGVLGILLRIYCMLPEQAVQPSEIRQNKRRVSFAPFLRVLFFLILVQGLVMPRLLCS